MKTITFSAPCIKRYETDDFIPTGDPHFIAIALKGEECFLQCDHCKTKMLSALYKADTPEKLDSLLEKMVKKGCKGVLVTGGCDTDGTIPIYPFVETLKNAKEKWGLKLAAHTKLANESFIEAVETAGIDLLMVDLVGENQSLHKVYHLKKFTIEDIEKSLELAAERNIPLAPHIMIGINQGKVVGEFKALEMLKGKPFEALVLVVLTPLRNTPMENCKIDQEGVIRVLEEAKRLFPHKRITLGCAKTWGKMQRVFEEKALELEFDSIAYPSDGLVDLAREKGFEVKFTEACCAFPWPFGE